MSGSARMGRHRFLCIRAPVRDMKESKKKERQGKKLTVANSVFAQTTHVDAAWSCIPSGLREVVLSFKFRQNRLNGFRDVGCRNLPFPIPKASGLYNSFYYRTSRDDVYNLLNSDATARWRLYKLIYCV